MRTRDICTSCTMSGEYTRSKGGDSGREVIRLQQDTGQFRLQVARAPFVAGWLPSGGPVDYPTVPPFDLGLLSDLCLGASLYQACACWVFLSLPCCRPTTGPEAMTVLFLVFPLWLPAHGVPASGRLFLLLPMDGQCTGAQLSRSQPSRPPLPGPAPCAPAFWQSLYPMLGLHSSFLPPFDRWA